MNIQGVWGWIKGVFATGRVADSPRANDGSLGFTGHIPRHIAIIMDGNGRWAQQHGLPRIFGHRRGVERVRDVAKACGDLGIKYLTLYAFSTENWKRPADEVQALMALFEDTMRKEARHLIENNVRVRIIGRRDGLPDSLIRAVSEIETSTACCDGLELYLAINYGGRIEITDAVQSIARKVLDRKLRVEDITEATIASHLYNTGVPDPDLVIRTSGELRISNFLLWQIAYSEFWVTRRLWPDFSQEDLIEAIKAYQQRKRRFGGIGETGAKRDVS